MNDGGPAFPLHIPAVPMGVGPATASGMSIRDYFAAMAMQGQIADNVPYPDMASLAKASYIIADAMLAERNMLTNEQRDWLSAYPPRTLFCHFVRHLRERFNLTPEQAGKVLAAWVWEQR